MFIELPFQSGILIYVFRIKEVCLFTVFNFFLQQDDVAFDNLFMEASFKSYIFKLRAKMENYNVSKLLCLLFLSCRFLFIFKLERKVILTFCLGKVRK